MGGIGKATHPNNSLLVFNYALSADDERRDPFRDFDFSNDIPNPVLREKLKRDPEKYIYYSFQHYGIHNRVGFTRQQWSSFEKYWTETKVAPGSIHRPPVADPTPGTSSSE